ncbi:MAG: thiamine pyrophosphate-requiring protein [Acidobacteriota bacterium]|nr:thiamine pyrophosphate-requiring protein [Acidobacteriota bacterium]
MHHADDPPRLKDRLVVDTVAEGLLELLEVRGVKYFFGGGAGTDFPPFIEAFAKRAAHGRTGGLRPITVSHEITAVAMAHGYAMVTGEPQAVMVHTIAGTANALGGLINATRARVPMLLTAGRTPITEMGHPTSRGQGIHWAQESFDQAGMVREFVKWDYELRRGEQLETVVDRALAITRNAPAGPVYLTLPLDVVGDRLSPLDYSCTPRLQPSSPTRPEPASLQYAAHVLARATNPLVVTSSLGRDPEAVGALVTLAERLAIPVVESWASHLSFPQDHPLHQGFDVGALLGTADVVIAIETDTPWFPKDAQPPEDATVIQIDDDPLYEGYPIRGFPTDIGLAGCPRSTLVALDAALDLTNPDPDVVESRRQRWTADHVRRRAAWKEKGDGVSHDAPLDYQWISRCIGDTLSPDDIAVTEISLDRTQVSFTQPGTFFNHAHSAVLGWGPGAALGAKLACPDRTVVCAIGDGSHVFGVPTATHLLSRAYDLPVLFVIYNNGGWQRTRDATRAYAPDGWATRQPSMPLCELKPSPRFELICEANGGYGELVDDPSELPAALARALDVVKHDKRQALLNVIAK